MPDKARELLERALWWLNEFREQPGVELGGLDKQIRAYLAEPEVKREALSDEEIETEYWDSVGWTSLTTFLAGVRFAEKHHGITGGEIDG